MSRKTKLDEKDYAILEILKRNATITNKELSERIGLSPPATLERGKKLVKEKYIKGSGCYLNWEKLKFKFRILLVVNVHPSDKDLYLETIREYPNVIQTFQVKQEDMFGLFNEGLRFISICAFRDQGQFLRIWQIVSAVVESPIKFYTLELEEEFLSVERIK